VLHAGALAARRIGAPLVWHRNDHTIFERAMVPEVRHEARFGRVGRMLRIVACSGDYRDAGRAAAVVTLDQTSRRMAERAYRRPAVAIACPPAERFFEPPPRDEARKHLGVRQGEFLVLGVGIMAPHRRFEDLVDALELVGEPGVRALIVGSDHVEPRYARAIVQRVGRLGLGGRIDVRLDSVDETTLRAAYAAADLFAFPNDHRQSFGLAPLEALASGTPVVVTRAAGVADVLTGRPGVRVVDPHAPAQLAQAISDELGSGSRAAVQETREWLRSELGGNRYAERLAALYADVSG
jgi:glycosyltransferase involved in cell wall biosynthesis